MEKEKIKINCPNCHPGKNTEDKTEMCIDNDYIFCPDCGLVLKIDWIKEISEKLNQLTLITS